MTLNELQDYIKKKDFRPDSKHVYFQKLIEEVGELAEVIRKDIRMKNDGKIKGTIEEELYDVLYYVVALANVYEIDLQHTFELKEAINRVKYGPKIHHMTLFTEPFDLTKNGSKTVEVRKNDDKRRALRPGDIIEFTKLPDNQEVIRVRVIELIPFSTFEEMYLNIPFSDFGCENWTMDDMLLSTYEIYSKEEESQWGTLAIRMELLDQYS